MAVMRYDAHEQLCAPARHSSHPARLAIGLVALAIASIFLTALARPFFAGLAGYEEPRELDVFSLGATQVDMTLNLFLYIVPLVSLALILRILHGRGWLTLIGSVKLAARQFGRVLLYLVAIYIAIGTLVPNTREVAVVPHVPIDMWLTFLPLAIPAILLQVSCEELIFRGYMQSQLAAFFSSKLIWMLMPSLIFGFAHVGIAETKGEIWLYVAWATAFGLAAADLTARAGTLGPAIAMHFINNFGAILVTSPDGFLDGLALYVFTDPQSETEFLNSLLIPEFMVLLCIWLTARIALRR
ncbi:MAG: CPBP family intramembrane metalloprotease [Roseovarius sp.]|nr:CPBP family intramembrane metalloprotease [Roseovarius sp.]MCY4291409.1 CPBP family intramembrane metalloprotease [Roseovarius sp.]MCY4314942.1 CPBP family intramembrane metalloprotease [Roseovarius sp.]